MMMVVLHRKNRSGGESIPAGVSQVSWEKKKQRKTIGFLGP